MTRQCYRRSDREQSRIMRKLVPDKSGRAPILTAAVTTLILVAVVAGALFICDVGHGSQLTTSASSTISNTSASASTITTAAISGVVAGFVYIGPSQPVCQSNTSCMITTSGTLSVLRYSAATLQSVLPRLHTMSKSRLRDTFLH